MGTKIYTATDALIGAPIPAIVESSTAQLDLEIGNAWHALRIAEQRETKTTERANEATEVARKAGEEAKKRRADLGSLLVDKHRALNVRKGDRSGKWPSFLEQIGIPAATAWRYMELAGFVQQSTETDFTHSNVKSVPTYADIGIDNRPRKSDEPLDLVTPRATREASTNRDVAELWAAEDDRQLDKKTERTGGRGKPEWLMRALIRDYTLAGDLVCDPLAGWGSTLRAALDEGRRAIGSEVDSKIAAQAAPLPIRVGDWRVELAGETVDAIIVDPPYSKRTHTASRKFGNERADGSPLTGLGPSYAAWTDEDVVEFVQSWSPRCRGWMVALTDHHLIPAWQAAYESAGRYSFAPVSVVIRGMTVRLCGDGPSSETLYCMVARPMTNDASRWRTLPGHYVGTKGRSLDELIAEASA